MLGLFGGFFVIYWFLYFLAFLLLISTSLWFYFVCEPFLPFLQDMNLVLSSDHSLLQFAYKFF